MSEENKYQQYQKLEYPLIDFLVRWAVEDEVDETLFVELGDVQFRLNALAQKLLLRNLSEEEKERVSEVSLATCYQEISFRLLPLNAKLTKGESE